MFAGPEPCPERHFDCGLAEHEGTCIPERRVCNCNNDCHNMEDETAELCGGRLRGMLTREHRILSIFRNFYFKTVPFPFSVMDMVFPTNTFKVHAYAIVTTTFETSAHFCFVNRFILLVLFQSGGTTVLRSSSIAPVAPASTLSTSVMELTIALAKARVQMKFAKVRSGEKERHK